MAITASGWLLNSFFSTHKHVIGINFLPIGFLQARNYAARKGTREKAKKKKVKVVVQKIGFIPHNKRTTKVEGKKTIIHDPIKAIFVDDAKSDPIDNVWITTYHKSKIYPFEEAIESHREMHHPTIYNQANAYVKAFIELDMQAEKKTKFVDTFTRIAHIPHKFDQSHESRKILAFCKDPEMQEIAKNAGAKFVGGKELIKQIQNGNFSIKEYDIILSEPAILSDLLLIRGIMKKKFPNIKTGTLNSDMPTLVTKFLTGVKYTAKPHDAFKTYGTADITFGTLDMNIKELEENFSAIVNDIHSTKPRRPEPFIRKISITSLPSKEHFKVNFEQYLPENNAPKKEEKEVEKKEEDRLQDVVSH